LADFAVIRLLAGALLIAGVFYATLCAGLFVWQRHIIFITGHERPEPVQAGVPGVEVLSLHTADGLDLLAWYSPPSEATRPVVLFLHGNSGHIGHRASRLARLAAAGWGALLVEYRGFGGNPGTPSEDGLALDARAAYAALTGRGIAADRIVVWGESLGTAVAVRLAEEAPVAAVLLEAPFTSMVEMARMRYPWVPVNALLRDRFETSARIAALRVPVLVMQGMRDDVVPPVMGMRLFAAATTPEREFWRAEAAGHNDLAEHGAVEAGIDFVTRRLGGGRLAAR
jgi:fermentation-respiration switch protein FrsA (DUF1100 family)